MGPAAKDVTGLYRSGRLPFLSRAQIMEGRFSLALINPQINVLGVTKPGSYRPTINYSQASQYYK